MYPPEKNTNRKVKIPIIGKGSLIIGFHFLLSWAVSIQVMAKEPQSSTARLFRTANQTNNFNFSAFALNQINNIRAPYVIANIPVKGTVSSNTGEPLPGVNILIKGTTNGTATDVNGNYSLDVAEDGVLVVSFVGFDTQEIKVNNRNQINIILTPSTKALEEVVVVGYGTIEKSDFTGSSSTTRLEGVNQTRNVSVPEALQGKVAGVQIMNNTGQPGSGMTFNIRGKTSITGSSQPLIVIDGQPVESDFGSTQAGTALDGGAEIPPADPLAAINPSDIESIEILKDASSTAIYGSRGANGVVLITTKSGKTGKDKIVYTTRFDLNVLPKKLKVLNTPDYLHYRNEAAFNDGADSVYTQFQMDSVIANSPNVDWQDEVYRKAISQEHQLSFSGKDEKSNYYITGNYTDQKSILNNADFIRYGLRVNYSRNVTKKLTLGLHTYFSMADRNYGQESNWTGILGSSAVMGALSFNPLRTAFNPSGDVDEEFANNPTLVTTLVKDKTQIRTLISNLTIDYKFNENLTYTLRGGVNDLYSLRQLYYPTGTFIGNSAPGGSATRADNSNSNYLIDNILTYKKVFGEKHSVNAVGGFSYQKWQNRESSNTAMNFPSNTLTYYNLQGAASPGRMYTGFRYRALQSFLGRINYAYNKRYLLTLTGRHDASSRLAEGNKSGFFPSVGLGWNVSNENFFQNNVKFVNYLKLRASYGVAGNENISIGATKAKYGINYVVVGASILPSYTTEDFANPNLKWETTRQYNLGADFGFLDDRITLGVDLYKKNTTDLLINLSLPASTTYSNYFTNVGEVMNRGVDIESNFKILQGEVNLDAGANFSIFDNKVISMGASEIIYGRSFFAGGQVLLGQPVSVAKPGLPISTFWGYKTNGIYQNLDEISADPALANDNSKSLVRPGDVKWVDVNGDGQITDADKTAIGNPSADFTYGFNTNLSYKRFTLSVNIFGSYGNDLLNLTRWVVGINNTTGNYNLLQSAYDGRWRGEGTSNLYPKVTSNSVRLTQRLPDWLIEDASFVRLQNVNLGYTFNLPAAIPLGGIRTFVSGTNLFTLTKYSGYDPNINAFNHLALSSGIDLGTMPQPRTYSVGLEVTF